MHLAEGMLPLAQAAAWSAAAVPALVWSVRGEQRVRRETESSSMVMAGVTSLLFAATLLPLPVHLHALARNSVPKARPHLGHA